MKKVLYGVLGLLALLSLFILACVFQPELAGKVSDLLYADRGAEEESKEADEAEGGTGDVSGVAGTGLSEKLPE